MYKECIWCNNFVGQLGAREQLFDNYLTPFALENMSDDDMVFLWNIFKPAYFDRQITAEIAERFSALARQQI